MMLVRKPHKTPFAEDSSQEGKINARGLVRVEVVPINRSKRGNTSCEMC